MEGVEVRIVFIGAEQAGYDVLEMLLDTKEDVVGVFTRKESDDIADYVNFGTLDTGRCYQYFEVDDIKDRTANIQGIQPDLIIVVSWSQIIPKEILDIAPTIGIHYSLLPERRGGAPIAWALIDGLEKSGITLFYYTEKIDAGDIIAQKEFDIRDDDRPDDLLKIINRLCVEIARENLPKIKDGTAPRIKQDESKATYTKKRTPADSIIGVKYWTKRTTLKQFHDYLRALDSPYPHAFIKMGNKRFEFSVAHLSGDGEMIYGSCTITEVVDDE